MIKLSKAKNKLKFFLNQAGKMAQWVKSSLCKHEDPSSVSQHSQKRTVLTYTSVTAALREGCRARRSLRALWPASLTPTASSGSRERLSQNQTLRW